MLISFLVASTNIEAKKTASKKSSTTSSYNFNKQKKVFVAIWTPILQMYQRDENNQCLQISQYLTAIFSDGRYESDYTYSWDQENEIVYKIWGIILPP